MNQLELLLIIYICKCKTKTHFLGILIQNSRNIGIFSVSQTIFVQLSCKIFEHFALQVDPVIGFVPPGSAPFKKVPFWCQNQLIHLSGGKATPPPLNLDPVYLIQIDSYFALFKDVCQMKYSYLDTRSLCVDTSFITQW